MDVEYTEIVTIINNNFDVCNYFNKFKNFSNATIKIGNKNILVNKDVIMKYSKFFNDFITDNPQSDNVYILNTEYPVNFIENTISYLYGCDLIFNINYFSIYYRIADYLMIDELTNLLRQNIEEGFNNRKYDLLQSLKIIIDLFYIGDEILNDILLSTIANNFMSLREQLKYIDINILQNIILRDDLNIDSELELILFLNNYYALHQNNDVEIDSKLIPNIRMLTLSIPEINDITNFLLSELPEYRKLIDRSLLSKNNDFASKAHLVINYKNIAIPRNSIIINEFNDKPEIANYHFGLQQSTGYNVILPVFPAIVLNGSLGRNLILQILNDVIIAEVKQMISIPKIGTMILVTDSIMEEEERRNTNISFNKCFINKFNIIYEHVPNIFLK
jgi:hypothetical protein